MNRPKMIPPVPVGGKITLPLGPATLAGHLTEISSGMRTFRPVIDPGKCVKCLRCFLLCPDGAIDKSEESLEIDYDYCKGCGVCSTACKFGAIAMLAEADV
jgi:pyruvate ferredoxin oxidoreductase delta subunit